jgi:hypothetical protein
MPPTNREHHPSVIYFALSQLDSFAQSLDDHAIADVADVEPQLFPCAARWFQAPPGLPGSD